ncbi:putative transcription factor PosF21 [Iris pallida]|uniref:Transcription factor PosF21 n=1 Tax=Iris pallida TaxID=29817 RepID=A0AAX6F3Q3_IRIPA|nr:putative transcription factor PosF21 [Iris pallida]
MDKDKLVPSSSRGYFPMKSEASASSSSSSSVPSPSATHGGASAAADDSNRFSHDVSRMPDFPTRSRGHRRAQSEILSLPDDITFDSDLGLVGPGAADGPSLSDETEEDFFSMYLDMDKLDKFGPVSATELMVSENSVEAGGSQVAATGGGNNVVSGGGERPTRARHQHSQSMDGSTSLKTEQLGSGSEGPSSLAEAKKAMSAEKLADLALVDPKRAKRIWANRQSAARSKERKMRYIAELERKVQTLQTEATTLSAQLTMLQRDTNGLTAENSELKLRLQTMEQQVHLQDALNDALREEVQRLKLATGQMMPNGPMMNFGPTSYGANQQYYHHNQAMQSLLAAHQLQQLQIHPQQQLHPHQHQPPTNPRMRGSMVAQSQREGTSENNNAHME